MTNDYLSKLNDYKFTVFKCTLSGNIDKPLC